MPLFILVTRLSSCANPDLSSVAVAESLACSLSRATTESLVASVFSFVSTAVMDPSSAFTLLSLATIFMCSTSNSAFAIIR